jgi:hypothetical protein
MSPTGPYSLDLMTRVMMGLGPPAAHYAPQEEQAPCWDKEVRTEPLSLAQSASILSDLVNTYVHHSISVASRLCSTSARLDQQSIGWLPPLFPSRRPCVIQNLPSTSSVSVLPVVFVAFLMIPRNRIPIISDLLKYDTPNCGYPDIHQDCAGSTSSGSTPTSSAFARSPSPFVPALEFDVGPVPMDVDEAGPLELSPLPALREKERKKIRQSSGVKPKAKAPQTHGPRNVEAAASSNPPLEMVQCKWEGCTKWLHVDYIDVGHWGKHIREHYADEQDMVQCKWDGGCGVCHNKSSMWKHIIVHEPKFKIRCTRGCDIFTRGDMMKRHLRTCNYTPDQAAKGNKEEGGSHGRDYDGDSEDSEEEGGGGWGSPG